MPEDARQVLVVADEWEPMEVLAAFLRAEGGYRARCVDQYGPDPDLTRVEAVFVYVHGVLEPYVEDALIDYALDGGRLIVLHHALASAKVANPAWLDLAGLHIAPRDDPVYPWRVVEGTHTLVNLQPEHYITSHGMTYDRTIAYRSSDAPSTSGVFPAIELHDTEAFLNQHFTDGRAKTVLYGFHIVDPESGEVYMQDRSVWYKPVGQGWLFYLQPGHAASDFRDPNYRQIVLNCLRWVPGQGPAPPQASPLASDTGYSALEGEPDGWVDITPGPELEGWRECPWPPGDAPSQAFQQRVPQWHVDPASGTLRCDGTTHAHLLTEATYGDHILHVEWRYTEPGEGHNSGVFVRMVPGERVMHQVETRYHKMGVVMGGTLVEGELTCLGAVVPGRDGRWKAVWPHVPRAWGEHVAHRRATPVVAVPEDLGPSLPTHVRPPGEWNTYEVTCRGGTITVRTNGTVSPYTDNCRVPEGAVGFESEGHPIEFRNIRLKPLG